jgi:hypothetical protein
MNSITYKDEAATWSRNNHVLEIKLLPTSVDSNSNFSETLEE